VKRNLIVVAVVAVAVGLMLWTASRMSRNPQRLAGNPAGAPAPEFELKSLDGRTVRLSDYRGKAVLLNFWATWCSPCKIEMPWFDELQNKYRAQGLEVIGIAMDDAGEETVAKFVKDLGVNYTILMGKEALGEAYGGVLGLPTTFYIDRQGRIVDQVVGLVSHSDIEDNIKKALGSGTTQASAPAGSAAAQPRKP
jgi:cytochrome c biogenesis protein CcmG/thiol:disulfide interchange protein DsbE